MANRAHYAHALLFSGHMVDAPGRDPPRFPPTLEAAARSAIRTEIDRVGTGPNHTAISSGACGGDLLFAEAVLDLGLPLRIYLPFDEATFIDKSVAFADRDWIARYRAVIAKAQRFIATDDLGPLPQGEDPYERTNLWMLDEAKRISSDSLSFICLWNGEGGDGPGGTKHMMSVVRERGGDVHWIDIRTLSTV